MFSLVLTLMIEVNFSINICLITFATKVWIFTCVSPHVKFKLKKSENLKMARTQLFHWGNIIPWQTIYNFTINLNNLFLKSQKNLILLHLFSNSKNQKWQKLLIFKTYKTSFKSDVFIQVVDCVFLLLLEISFVVKIFNNSDKSFSLNKVS